MKTTSTPKWKKNVKYYIVHEYNNKKNNLNESLLPLLAN